MLHVGGYLYRFLDEVIFKRLKIIFKAFVTINFIQNKPDDEDDNDKGKGTGRRNIS